MKKLNEVTAIVYDSSGLYTNLAIKLAKDFKKVYYYHNFKNNNKNGITSKSIISKEKNL